MRHACFPTVYNRVNSEDIYLLFDILSDVIYFLSIFKTIREDFNDSINNKLMQTNTKINMQFECNVMYILELY